MLKSVSVKLLCRHHQLRRVLLLFPENIFLLTSPTKNKKPKKKEPKKKFKMSCLSSEVFCKVDWECLPNNQHQLWKEKKKIFFNISWISYILIEIITFLKSILITRDCFHYGLPNHCACHALQYKMRFRCVCRIGSFSSKFFFYCVPFCCCYHYCCCCCKVLLRKKKMFAIYGARFSNRLTNATPKCQTQ